MAYQFGWRLEDLPDSTTAAIISSNQVLEYAPSGGFIVSANCTITGIFISARSTTAKKLALYDFTTKALLGETAEFTDNVDVLVPLITPVALLAGDDVGIDLLASGSATGVKEVSNFRFFPLMSQTYASGFPATWTFSSTSNRGRPVLWADGTLAGDPPAIDGDGTDTAITSGGSHQIEATNVVSPPASLELVYDNGVEAPIAVSQADFVYTEDTEDDTTGIVDFTCVRGSLPYTNGDQYDESFYTYVVTCADASEIVYDLGLTLLPQPGRSFVTAVDPVTENSIIPVWEEGEAVNGDQVDYPTDQCTVRPNFTFYGEAGSTKNFTIEYFDSENFDWYTINVTVTFGDDGEGTVITARGFTVEGFTVRGFTRSGF